MSAKNDGQFYCYSNSRKKKKTEHKLKKNYANFFYLNYFIITFLKSVKNDGKKIFLYYLFHLA